MSLIQIFSNKLYFNKNLEIFVKTLEDNKNNLIQDNSNLFIIKKENETIYSIDFKNKLKLNNVFCYLKLNNDIKINLNIYIKGKPFNFENFYILKTFRENFAINNIKGEISLKKNFTNNFFEFNIDSLYEIINDEKNIISKVKKDLNIFENLQIDKILKLKKFNFFEKDDCKKSISFIVFNEYNFNNESIHFESKNYIIRFITANPYHEFDNYNRFILFLKNRNIILEQDWDKLFFYI